MTTTPDPWDDSSREAYTLGEVIVYRGEWPAVEIDVVALDRDADDAYGDACRRAFGPVEEMG